MLRVVVQLFCDGDYEPSHNPSRIPKSQSNDKSLTFV